MITLNFAFWMMIILFAVIGAMRGWSKELLVTFAAILGLFVIAVIERFAPQNLRQLLLTEGSPQFWIRSGILIVLVFFGYQTPNLSRIPQERFVRERLSDTLLGFFIGALNGYLIVGSILYFMAVAGWPFTPNITPPTTESVIFNYLPPEVLLANNSPLIYFAVAVAFVFVLVVFI